MSLCRAGTGDSHVPKTKTVNHCVDDPVWAPRDTGHSLYKSGSERGKGIPV